MPLRTLIGLLDTLLKILVVQSEPTHTLVDKANLWWVADIIITQPFRGSGICQPWCCDKDDKNRAGATGCRTYSLNVLFLVYVTAIWNCFVFLP